MPPKGYKTITVKEIIVQKLEPIAEAKGMPSVGSLVTYILQKYIDETKGIHHFE